MSEQRGNLYTYDPITDLRIVGGASLPAEQRGDLDTPVDIDHPLYDERVELVLAPEFVANVDMFGIIQAIRITKIDGVVHVVAGRQRVRAARLINRARVARGEPPMRVEATLVRPTNEVRLTGSMIAENEGRVNDDFSTKVAKLKRYMERGVSLDDAAVTFNIKIPAAKAMIAFDDNATPELRAAVVDGRLSLSAGIEILRGCKTPEAQLEILAATTANAPTTGKISTRSARTATKRATKPDAVIGVDDRRTQRRLFQAVRDMPHPNASKETLAWYQGIEDAFKIVLGETDTDPRLVAILDKVRAAAEAKS